MKDILKGVVSGLFCLSLLISARQLLADEPSDPIPITCVLTPGGGCTTAWWCSVHNSSCVPTDPNIAPSSCICDPTYATRHMRRQGRTVDVGNGLCLDFQFLYVKHKTQACREVAYCPWANNAIAI